MSHREKLLTVYTRTLKNCLYYWEEGKPAALLNEIGVLRGCVYALEQIVGENNIFDYIQYDLFSKLIDKQQELKIALEIELD